MPDINVDVNIEVWCSCGEGLCGQTRAQRGSFTVEPCEKCLENARQEGYDEGHEDGYLAAVEIEGAPPK